MSGLNLSPNKRSNIGSLPRKHPFITIGETSGFDQRWLNSIKCVVWLEVPLILTKPYKILGGCYCQLRLGYLNFANGESLNFRFSLTTPIRGESFI